MRRKHGPPRPVCEFCGAPLVQKPKEVWSTFLKRRTCGYLCSGRRIAAEKTRPVVDRFWEKVDKNGPELRPDLGQCWIWTAGRFAAGYGNFGVGSGAGRTGYAHRFSLALNLGRPIKAGLFVLHK